MSNQNSQTIEAGRPIPPISEFPVDWEDPNDAKLTWQLSSATDKPVPLLVEAITKSFLEAMNTSFELGELPVRLRVECINTFQYLGIVPIDAPPEIVAKGMILLNRAAPGAGPACRFKVGSSMLAAA